MVIMGLAFADIEGVEFVRKALDSFSGPVIVISSSVDKMTEEKLIDLGIRAAFNKSGPWQEGLKPHLAGLKQD